MHGGRRRSFWRVGFLASALGLLAGCAVHRAQIDERILTSRPTPDHLHDLAREYHAHCPDVVQVEVSHLPQYSGPRRIGTDGRIELGDSGRLRVEGETPGEMARLIAESLGVAPASVRVGISE